MNKIRKNIFGFLFSGFALNACLLSFGMNRHEIVKKLYNSKIKYDKNDFEINIFNNGWNLLYYAINNNNLNMFKFFLECGATIDYAGSEQAKSNEKNNQFDAKKILELLDLVKKFDEETILFKKFEFIDFEKDAQIKEILQKRLDYKIFGCSFEEINMQFKKKRLGQTDTVMKPEFGKVSVEGQYFDCKIKFLNNN